MQVLKFTVPLFFSSYFSFSLGGQLKLAQFSFDGAISYLTSTGQHRLELVNFHAAYTHGCEDACTNPNQLYADRVEASKKTDHKIRLFLNHLAKELDIHITFKILTDCPHHRAEPLSDMDKREAHQAQLYRSVNKTKQK